VSKEGSAGVEEEKGKAEESEDDDGDDVETFVPQYMQNIPKEKDSKPIISPIPFLVFLFPFYFPCLCHILNLVFKDACAFCPFLSFFQKGIKAISIDLRNAAVVGFFFFFVLFFFLGFWDFAFVHCVYTFVQ
jgi:hypothetical protein